MTSTPTTALDGRRTHNYRLHGLAADILAAIPTIRELAALSSLKLRRNGLVEDVVASFQAARPEAFRVATERKLKEEDETNGRPIKRRRTHKDDGATSPSSQRQTRSRTKTQHNASAEVTVIDDDEEDGNYEEESQPDDGLVPCPMCGGRMKEEAVFTHLDRCDGIPSDRKKSQTPVIPLQLKPQSRPPSQPQERLSELSYGMMSDAQIRRKMKDMGIQNTGSKELMVRRHKEWVSLWNSNCDSARPKSKRELLHELDMWERSQGGLARDSHGTLNGIMKKDFDAKAYASSHSDDFSRLIQEAKKKAKANIDEAQQGHAPDTNGDGRAEESFEASMELQPGLKVTLKHANTDPVSTTNGTDIRGAVDASMTSQQNSNLEALHLHSTVGLQNGTSPQAKLGTSEGPHRRESIGLGAHFADQPTRRLPMFAVSTKPVTDVESGSKM
ncbi:DNA repair protein rad18 [Sphaceloma murrayae]|uniref:RING-type E3 ubiquitin transferase n=1 Tax=Sphaceloma murrayae TaxID=2082308 RepID=A0A2K1QUP9_9PEZI|nr:DNA repair protein rad18 [Sphaceloma murrayae]